MAGKNWIIGLFFFVMVIIFASCQSGGDRLDVDLSNVDIEPIKIKRYEQHLFAINPDNLVSALKKIQPDFGVFLNGDLDDTLNIMRLANYIDDTLLRNVNNDCQNVFPNLEGLEADLNQAFRYHTYYYPKFEAADVYTYISGFDYEHPVQLMEQNVLISIDMYLGKEYYRYKKLGLPAYMLNRFDQHYIVKDCMKELAKQNINYRKIGPALLDMMVNEGKMIYYTNAMIPSISDSILMNYTAAQMEWAINAEGSVWAFLLENEMLYAKENQPIQKFILESPFTSYFGAESPPRLGWFMGWKIVSSYMQKNQDVELYELMNEYDAQKILQQSGYKPGI